MSDTPKFGIGGLDAGVGDSDDPYVDQFIHGRAEGPIQMAVKERATTTAPISANLGAG